MKANERIAELIRRTRSWVQGSEAHEQTLEVLGKMLSWQVAQRNQIDSLHDVEFRVFSQWGDDGIIQWLVNKIPSLPKSFIEFGVEDYSESTTRFLMVNNNWRGLVMDASNRNIGRLRQRRWFWRYDLTGIARFLTQDNIDLLIREWCGEASLGLLHVDVDGNDYWLWDAIQSVAPGVVIVEYNAVFGFDRAVTVPYRKDFERFAAHFSGQYAGASLPALTDLAAKKGYGLIGTNSAGNNAYFLRRDLLDSTLREISVGDAFVYPNFRECRSRDGHLNFASYAERQSVIRGLPVVNVLSGQIEPF